MKKLVTATAVAAFVACGLAGPAAAGSGISTDVVCNQKRGELTATTIVTQLEAGGSLGGTPGDGGPGATAKLVLLVVRLYERLPGNGRTFTLVDFNGGVIDRLERSAGAPLPFVHEITAMDLTDRFDPRATHLKVESTSMVDLDGLTSLDLFGDDGDQVETSGECFLKTPKP